MVVSMQTRCPDCKSENVAKTGKIPTRQGRKQRYRCNKCGRTFYTNNIKEEKSED